MEHNRKLVIIGSIFLLALFGLLFILNYEEKAEAPFYWIGLLAGGILGVLTCIYIKMAWGPIDIRSPNDTRHQMQNSAWMPISVIAGLVLSKIILLTFPEYTLAMGNCFTSWIFVTLSYFTFRIWSKRPRA